MQKILQFAALVGLGLLTACVQTSSRIVAEGESVRIGIKQNGKETYDLKMPNGETFWITVYDRKDVLTMHHRHFTVPMAENEKYVRLATGCEPTFAPKKNRKVDEDPNIAYFKLKCPS